MDKEKFDGDLVVTTGTRDFIFISKHSISLPFQLYLVIIAVYIRHALAGVNLYP